MRRTQYANVTLRDSVDRTLFCGGHCQPSESLTCDDSAAESCGLCPLAHFYSSLMHPLPPISRIAVEDLPEPYRHLLVHRRGMTSMLEEFHGSRTHVHLLRCGMSSGIYERQVVLELNGSDKPVELGALMVQLNGLPPEARSLIIEGRQPFGGILAMHGVKFISRPKAYLRVEPDKIIADCLALQEPAVLYGRCNALYGENDHLIADIVEILPPVQE